MTPDEQLLTKIVAAVACWLQQQQAPRPALPLDWPDGPFCLRNFSYGGVVHRFGKNDSCQFRMLALLWAREEVSAQELADHVYGDDVDVPESRMRALALDLSKTLDRWGVPFAVRPASHGYFELVPTD